MSEPRIQPLDATFGATVTGVRLAALSDAEWKAVEEAFHAYALLIFPGQHITAREQVAFAERFGAIEHLYGRAGWIPISNRGGDGKLMADDAQPMQIMRGNEGWHTDSSYMPLAAKASVLAAHTVPASGGQTEWADMRAAYEALDDATRARIAELSAYHSLKRSQALIGHTDASTSFYGFHDGEPPLRPLVKVHPVTGRPALYIGRHAYGIPGLDPHESETLLDALLDAACRPPRVYEHAWQSGDVAIWDNRCLLHRARPYDHGEARVMRHVRIAGDPATERAQA
jgi:alpha-ketoglutarate-dependent taurine dioxygenase